jgi:hypothetical protein
MALTGHLSDLSLSELIEFFCNQRKTGQLKVLYPQGPGYFYLQTGSVVDARIGVLRGIDAVYFALTLPNAKFEFGSASEPGERTINQPWTQVVLEGLRRLDEGIVPATAFPPEYEEPGADGKDSDQALVELENPQAPAFLSFISSESGSKRKFAIAGAVAFAVLVSVAAIGVPAGWYSRARASAVANPPASTAAATIEPTVPVASETESTSSPESSQASDRSDEAAQALKRQREKEREKEKAREEKAAAAQTQAASGAPAPASTNASSDSAKAGPKKITVTVTYDESGRVTQASGGDASAVRIARQKRFPAGKAGSATITIPIN